MTTETPNPADGTGKPASGGSAAGTADFDAILAEYTNGTKSTDTKPNADVGRVLTELKPVIDFAHTELTDRHNKAVKEEVSNAIKFVKEEKSLEDMPDEVVRGMLEVYGSEHPEFATAFQNRGKDKANWQAQLKSAREAVTPVLSKLVAPATRVTSDVVAARAAVSGEASKPPVQGSDPTPQQMFSMSERDFRAMLDKDLAR